MVIDCDTCVVRGLACGDCVVSVLLGSPPAVELDAVEQRAIDALGRAGIVPRLRLEPRRETRREPRREPRFGRLDKSA